MPDTKTSSEIACDSELHGEHLCYVISQGLHIAEEKAYLALIESPQFRCGHCGRLAKNAKNLCVPGDLLSQRTREVERDHR